MPTFLQVKDIEALQKDTCLFCNEQFPTKSKIEKGTRRVGSDDDKEWIETERTVFYIAELDMHHFTFAFPQEEKEKILATKASVYQGIIDEVKRQATRRKEELERILPLEGIEKTLAIEAVVENILHKVTNRYEGGSAREQELNAWYKHLFLEDLERACHLYNDDNTEYKPKGIKVHPRCWPYDPVFFDTKKRVEYRNFLARLEQTPKFKGYTKRLEEHLGIFNTTKDLHIDLKIKRYNPLKFL